MIVDVAYHCFEIQSAFEGTRRLGTIAKSHSCANGRHKLNLKINDGDTLLRKVVRDTLNQGGRIEITKWKVVIFINKT